MVLFDLTILDSLIMINDLRAIAIFSETARLGSFKAAANTLGLSPSVVSYHITQLEERVGTALLYRSTRKLSLTTEGQTLFEHSLSMMAAAQNGLDQISSITERPSGKLKLAMPSVLTRSYINQTIAEFSKKYPGIALDIKYSDKRHEIITEGFDLAIRIGTLEDSALKAKKMGYIDRKLVCAHSYLNDNPDMSKPQSPNELEQWRWIQLSQLNNQRSFINEDNTKQTVQCDGNITVDNVEAMTQFCLSGLGIATPPDYLVDDLIKQGDLMELLPSWKVESIPLYVVWPSNVSDNSNTKRLINFLCKNT